MHEGTQQVPRQRCDRRGVRGSVAQRLLLCLLTAAKAAATAISLAISLDGM